MFNFRHLLNVSLGYGAVIAAVVLLIAACNKQPQSGQASSSAASGSTQTPADAAAGLDAYQTAGCIRCHGMDRQGGSMAPPLKDLALYWNQAQLEAYLANPPGYAATDQRLAEQAGKYTLMMPAVDDEAKRKVLAAWLMTQ